MATNQITSEALATPTRSRFTLQTVIWVFIIIGLVISGYLTGVKFTEEPLAQQLFGIEPQIMVCLAGDVFNCSTVQNSIYAKFMGIPIAYLGFAMYLALAGLMLLENRSAFLREYGKLLMFGIGLFAWMYSMYLVYLQVVVLRALCQWCLLHEINMTILFPLMGYRLWKHLQGDDEKSKNT
jgi:uncharacterized membrane protein